MSLELYFGTFSGSVVKFHLDLLGDVQLEQKFLHQVTPSCIKKIAVSYPFLAAGGTDEKIYLLNIKKNVQHGSLIHHSSTITALETYKESRSRIYLFSSSEGGKLAIWRSKDWEVMSELRGHRGSIRDFSIHPTGKLLTTISADQTLKIWNLSTSKVIVTQKMPKPGQCVQWSRDGSSYIVARDKKVLMYNVDGVTIGLTKHPYKVSCIAELSDKIILAGLDNGYLRIWDSKESKPRVRTINAHERRVRALKSPINSDLPIIVSFDGSGRICVWDESTLMTVLDTDEVVDKGEEEGETNEKGKVSNEKEVKKEDAVTAKNEEERTEESVAWEELEELTPMVLAEAQAHLTCCCVREIEDDPGIAEKQDPTEKKTGKGSAKKRKLPQEDTPSKESKRVKWKLSSPEIIVGSSSKIAAKKKNAGKKKQR